MPIGPVMFFNGLGLNYCLYHTSCMHLGTHLICAVSRCLLSAPQCPVRFHQWSQIWLASRKRWDCRIIHTRASIQSMLIASQGPVGKKEPFHVNYFYARGAPAAAGGAPGRAPGAPGAPGLGGPSWREEKQSEKPYVEAFRKKRDTNQGNP